MACRTSAQWCRRRTRSSSSTAPAPRISRSSKCRRSSAPDGCPRWPMPPRCSPASRARPASATRRSYRISQASIARWRPASPKLPCSPRPRTPSAARTSIRASTNRWPHTHRSASARTRRAFACAAICRRHSAVRSKAPARLADLGVFEVAISDTIGIAHPGQVPRVLDAVLARVPVHQLALHFHDTLGTALANVLASLQYGITTFDASAGGLGGCPYAPGAAGNLATDDLIYMLDGLGLETGVSLAAVSDASAFIASKIDHRLPSRYAQAQEAQQRLKPEA